MARWLAILLLLAAASPAPAAEGAATVAEAMTSGDPEVSLRYRFEHVDQDGFPENARASTVRLRLGYGTGSWRNVRLFGEFDYVGALLVDDYDGGAGTSPERAAYPLVADPEGADLNQLYLDYRSGTGWLGRMGRQRILLGNQRFVGGVGWRQNEQTFDAVSLRGRLRGGVDMFYAWIANANRIFGDTVAAGDHRMNTHLLDARIDLGEHAAITAYLHLIDNEDDPTASTATREIGRAHV